MGLWVGSLPTGRLARATCGGSRSPGKAVAPPLRRPVVDGARRQVAGDARASRAPRPPARGRRYPERPGLRLAKCGACARLRLRGAAREPCGILPGPGRLLGSPGTEPWPRLRAGAPPPAAGAAAAGDPSRLLSATGAGTRARAGRGDAGRPGPPPQPVPPRGFLPPWPGAGAARLTRIWCSGARSEESRPQTLAPGRFPRDGTSRPVPPRFLAAESF